MGNTSDRDPEQKARRRAWIIAFCIGLVLLLGAGSVVAYNLINPPVTAPATAVMPSVQNQTQTDAMNLIMDAGFGPPTIENEHSDTVESGQAIRTSPEGGTDVPLDRKIVLYMSMGPAAVEIPATLPGMTEPEARDMLRSLGLQGGVTTEANSATVPAGRVLSTTPAPGESVPTGSAVNLVLSTGKVTVPNVVGTPQENAVGTLTGPELVLTVTVNEEENSVVEPGIVTGQDISAGTNVEQGSTVSITVAKAPVEPTPDPSASPSATPAPPEKEKPGKKD